MDTQNVTIQGLSFRVPRPYSAGHQLSENEASALNQLLAENLRNNFSNRVQAWRKDNGDADISPEQQSKFQADLDTYAAEYKFGERGVSRTVDPIEKETREIAEKLVVKKLRDNGTKMNSVKRADINAAIDKLLAADVQGKIRKRAEKNVRDLQAMADLEVQA